MSQNKLFYLDLFGKKPTFLVNSRKSFATVVGVIVSVLVSFISLAFIFYFGIHVIRRENQNLIITDYIDESPLRVNLSSNKFAFAIGLQHPNYTLYTDESIYTINASLITIIRNENEAEKTIEKPLNLVNCSNFTFEVIPDYFPLMDLNNLYCLEINEDEVYLEGSFGNQVWTYISLDFYRCRDRPECQSNEVVEQILDGGYIGMFVSDYSIYPKNFDKPFNTYGKNIFTTFSCKNYLDFWVFIKKVEVITDSGYLLPIKNSEDGYSYETTLKQNDDRVNDNFMKVKVRLSQTRTVYERSYDKFQNIAASSGGIIQVCIIIGEIITFFFKEMLFREYIYSIYNYSNNKNYRNDTSSLNCSSIIFSPNQKHKAIDGASPLDCKNKTRRILASHSPNTQGKLFSKALYANEINGTSRRIKPFRLNSGNLLLIFCSRKVRSTSHKINIFFENIKKKFSIENFLFLQDELEFMKKQSYSSLNQKSVSSSRLILFNYGKTALPKNFE